MDNEEKKKIKHGGKNSRTKSRREYPEMSVLFTVKGATKRKIVRRLRKKDRKKPVSANLACDTDYSLNITLKTYMASLNKWILDIEVIYHLCYFRELLADFCVMDLV